MVLLHRAFVPCGRLFSCLLVALPLFFGSCQKETSVQEDIVHTSMRAFYEESCGLLETSADSVCNYHFKFSAFHAKHPECENDELFPPTTRNISDAFTHYGIVQIGSILAQTEWEGEIVINY